MKPWLASITTMVLQQLLELREVQTFGLFAGRKNFRQKKGTSATGNPYPGFT